MFSSARLIGSCSVNTFTCFVRPVTRRCSNIRYLSSTSVNRTEAAIAIPSPDGPDKVYPANIEKLVADISRLTLIEVSDLNELLKLRLKIPDAAPMAAMPLGMMAAQPAQEEESPVKVAQTSFVVKLTGFDPAKKISVIKYIKGCMEDFNLVQAKKFVETLPVLVKADLGQTEAEKLKDELVAAGAMAVVE